MNTCKVNVIRYFGINKLLEECFIAHSNSGINLYLLK